MSKTGPKQKQPKRQGSAAPGARASGSPTTLPANSTGPETVEDAASATADLEALRVAIVDAAGVSAGVWFSYIFILLYLLIAVASITHRDLFFENPVKLPFLSVDLPLIGFFMFGPYLLIVIHAYVLLHFCLFAHKVRAFHKQLDTQGLDANSQDVGDRLRLRLPINIFIQLLAGLAYVRRGVISLFLRLIAWTTLVVAPVLLFIFFVFQFLPYHSAFITWSQRICLVGDLVALWLLWPKAIRADDLAGTIEGKKLAYSVLLSQ
jgi:hypothetical protein